MGTKNPDLEDALAKYVHALSESAERTRRAEDRPMYESHLAAAARMFGALRGDAPAEALKAIVAVERRSYGRGFLSEDAGQRAGAAFRQFASLVESI